MLNLLFVDDETHVLEGLQRSIRPLREEWSAEFASSGTEALSRFSQHPFDVIVTDMRMPGLDGAQLLREVERRYPAVVRIVLSGHCVEEDIMRTVGPAHQFLTKPCDTPTLKNAIDRACALQRAVSSTAVREVVTRVNSLPSLPSLFEEVVAELSSKTGTMQRVGEIIEKDVAMTAKVLQIINSSFFGFTQRITRPSQAVAMLGQSTIKALVLSAGVFSQFANVPLKGLDLDALIQHSTAVGMLAAKIAGAETTNQDLISAAQLAGMVHDVGKLVLAGARLSDYKEIRQAAAEKGCTECRIEHERLGASHAEVGGYLLGVWGLPTSIVEAVAFHHEPDHSPAQQFVPLYAVHFSNIWYETRERSIASEVPSEVKLNVQGPAREELEVRLPIWLEIARKLDAKQGK